MLLLVVGLVVLVLVIVVVVFLSVRSMRAEDDEGYPARPARRESYGREPARRDSAGRGSAGRGRAQPRRGADSARSRARQSSAGQKSSAGQNRASGDYQTAMLPRPRGAQHDQDPADDRRDSPRRRPRPTSRAAAGRDRSGGDWSDTDWGGVSDEQYWAEMSSDKPLTTTARSAQAGPAAQLGDDAGAASFPARREPARTMASATHREAAPASGGRSDNSTDPRLGVPGGWSGSDNATTAAFSTDETARWRGQREAADDPLTSPSFGAHDGYGTDGRSYRDSHDRGQGQRGHVADRYDDGYGSRANGNGYSVHGNAAQSASYGLDTGYRSGGLEPLPEPGGAATAPRQPWHAAPVPTDSYTEPAGQGWDQGGSHYQDPPLGASYQNGHEDQAPGYGYGDTDSYGAAGQHGWPGEQYQEYPSDDTQSWQDAQPGYGHGGGYGYGQEQGYGQSGGYGYEQQGYGDRGDYGQSHADGSYGQHGRRR